MGSEMCIRDRFKSLGFANRCSFWGLDFRSFRSSGSAGEIRAESTDHLSDEQDQTRCQSRSPNADSHLNHAARDPNAAGKCQPFPWSRPAILGTPASFFTPEVDLLGTRFSHSVLSNAFKTSRLREELCGAGFIEANFSSFDARGSSNRSPRDIEARAKICTECDRWISGPSKSQLKRSNEGNLNEN